MLVRVWDYVMRRKAWFLLLITAIVSVSWGSQILWQSQQPSSLAQEPNPAEKLTFENDLLLQIGDNNPSLTLKFSQNFSLATVNLSDDTLAHDAYIRILDQNGQLLAGEYTEVHDDTPLAPQRVQTSDAAEEAPGVSYTWIGAPKAYEVQLLPGYIIEIHGESAEFNSTLDGKTATAFRPTESVERYVVMKNGLRKASWSEEEGDQQVYELLRRHIVAMLSDYQAKVTDEVLNNRHLDTATKMRLILAYRSLRPDDQALWYEFVEHLRVGGVPEITYHGEREYFVGEAVDFSQLVSAKDGEDGEIPLDEIEIENEVDFDAPGEYMVRFSATDSDGNTTRLKVKITINKPNRPIETPEPNEPVIDEPSFKPEDQNPVVMPDTDLNEVEDFPETNLPNIPPAAETVVSIGSGANTADPVDEETTESRDEEAGGTHAPTAEELDAAVEVVRPARNANPDENQAKSAESEGISVGQILLIGGGILLLAGLIRFIFDHYIR